MLRYETISGDLRFNSNTYTSGASNPFGSATIRNYHYSMYGTYG
jgi:hypothetical protein